MSFATNAIATGDNKKINRNAFHAKRVSAKRRKHPLHQISWPCHMPMAGMQYNEGIRNI
jgi:hypothetical protein